jgi:hypothetical protein
LISSIILAVAIATPYGIPSSIRQECAAVARFMAEVKRLQMSGKSEDSILDDLKIQGYGVAEEKQEKLVRILIQISAEDMSTPEMVRAREERDCLKDYKPK